MASESVTLRTVAPSKRPDQPSESTRQQLQMNGWVCDFEVHEALWQAQAILRLAAAALQEGDEDPEVAEHAILGAERLLVAQIRRAGWEGTGHMWKNHRKNHVTDDTPPSSEEPRGRELAGTF